MKLLLLGASILNMILCLICDEDRLFMAGVIYFAAYAICWEINHMNGDDRDGK